MPLTSRSPTTSWWPRTLRSESRGTKIRQKPLTITTSSQAALRLRAAPRLLNDEFHVWQEEQMIGTNSAQTGGKHSGKFRLERGSTSVEMAFVFAFFLVPLLLVTLDVGRWFYYAIEIQNAAQAAAQYGAQNIGDGTGITNAATTDAHDISGLAVNTTVGCECSDGTGVKTGTNANPCPSPPSCSGGASVVDYVHVTTSGTYT